MAVFLFFAAAPMKANAQCPATTYSVGSAVGFPDLSSAPAGVANLTAGQSIKITGTFTVDAGTWNISGADVFLTTSASEIIVNSGATLNASSNAVFKGCNTTYSWLAIRVLSGGTILADHCDFDYGVNAVNITGTATFHLTNNNFNNCGNGLRISGAQNPANHTVDLNYFRDSGSAGIFFAGRDVTIGYNYYTHAGLSPASTGIRISAGQNLTAVDGGNMINLDRGVEITPVPGSRCIDIQKLVFSGNTGVYSEQGQYRLNIQDCSIRATKTGIDIRNHITSQTPPSGVSCNGNITIFRNVVNSFTETCIRVVYVNGNGTVTVVGNTIGTEINSSTVFTYYGIEIFQALYAKIVVEANTITNQGNLSSPNHPGAIYLNNCKKENSISYNIINAAQFGGFGDLKFGITAANSPHLLVRNNTVDGGPNIAERAISIENPNTDIDLCCNTMTRSVKGLYFLGAHEDCIIQTSTFGAHIEALYYDMVVSTSAPQIHRGNNWSGASTMYDGYFNGSPLLAPNVEYLVDPTLLPNLLSQIFVTGGSPSDWFSTPTASELNCNAVCGNGFTEGGGEEELTGNDYWALNPLSDPAYEALHWGAQRYVYAKLLANPSLLQDPQAAAFFSAAQNGNLGKFYSIEIDIANLYDPELTSDPAQKLTELQSLNTSISTEADYQAYEKNINAVYLTALSENDWDFSESERATIDEVAALCPQAAGNAVYTARYLQENYRVPYWNMDCAFVGARDASLAPKASGFAIFPNPAQTEVQVALEQPALEDCRIMVFNLIGQIVAVQPVSEGSISATLPVATFANGCYIVTITRNGRQAYRQKLSIIR